MNKQDFKAYIVGVLTTAVVFVTWAAMVWLTIRFPLLIIVWVLSLHGFGMFNLRSSRNEREAEADLYDEPDSSI